MNHNILSIIALSSILCGILIIVSKNPIVSVLFLIGLFISIAGYLMMLGINFIGLSYLLVYVGAVSILFLFILMLINVRISELVTGTNNSIPLAMIIIALVGASELSPNIIGMPVAMKDVVSSAHMGDMNIESKSLSIDYSNNVHIVSFPCWDETLAETSHITTIGNIIYTSYPIWLILTSIILLLAMIGSILITIKQ